MGRMARYFPISAAGHCRARLCPPCWPRISNPVEAEPVEKMLWVEAKDTAPLLVEDPSLIVAVAVVAVGRGADGGGFGMILIPFGCKYMARESTLGITVFCMW